MTVQGANKEGTEVYLSNNEHFQVGDILEVTTVAAEEKEPTLLQFDFSDKNATKQSFTTKLDQNQVLR